MNPLRIPGFLFFQEIHPEWTREKNYNSKIIEWQTIYNSYLKLNEYLKKWKSCNKSDNNKLLIKTFSLINADCNQYTRRCKKHTHTHTHTHTHVYSFGLYENASPYDVHIIPHFWACTFEERSRVVLFAGACHAIVSIHQFVVTLVTTICMVTASSESTYVQICAAFILARRTFIHSKLKPESNCKDRNYRA